MSKSLYPFELAAHHAGSDGGRAPGGPERPGKVGRPAVARDEAIVLHRQQKLRNLPLFAQAGDHVGVIGRRPARGHRAREPVRLDDDVFVPVGKRLVYLQ